MPLLPVLVEMEFQGVTLDTSALREMSTQLGEEAAGLKERICSLAGVDFNLQSPKQLGEVLFDHLRLLEKPKKTATGQYATGEEILSELAPHHEIVRLILDYREITKLKSTYVDALPLTIHPRTGRVHTTYSQTAAATGRLSSNDPNLQNIPIRSERGQEIRKAFVPRAPGRVLISADYSQIELRVMASLSGDPGMKEAFVQGLDIHTATAARVFHVPLEFVTSEMRRKAKMVNFGIIYGISAFGLSQRLGVSRQEAATIIDAYFRQYPGVRAFMDRTTSECRRSGHVETLSGRRRRIPDIDSRNATLRAAAERVAINSPIQGTAADMIKLAMIRVASELPTAFPDAHMILQVHDEIIVDAPADHAPAIINLLSTLMSNALPLDVPILVDARSGTNWLQAH